MSTPEARRSLAWLQGLATDIVATLQPEPRSDGGLALHWTKAGLDYTAVIDPDGSLFLHSEQHGPEWAEAAENVKRPGPDAENRVRDFCLWPNIREGMKP